MQLANWVFDSHKSCPVAEYEAEESDRLFEFGVWLDENRLTAIVVAGVALIGGFYIYISQFNAEQLVGEAGSTLEATNIVSRQFGSVPPKSYKSVKEQYPDSSAGQRAWLLWARGLLDAGKYQDAQDQFEEFLGKNGKSPMAPGAELGRALCLDELSKKDEAKDEYTKIIEKYPGQLVAQYATINLAALHQEDGQPDKARDLYQKLIDSDLTFFDRKRIPDINRDGVVNEEDERFLRQFGQGVQRRMASSLAMNVKALLLEKNPQLRTERQNPHIPPIIPTVPESNSTGIPEGNGTAIEANNATQALPKDANTTKQTPSKTDSKEKSTPDKPKKSGK